MTISDADYKRAQTKYPTLSAIRGPHGQIDRVQVQMTGIAGGGSHTHIVYHTIVTFEGYPGNPPTAWITHPSDGQIRHMNIFHPGSPLNLPHVCMGNYGSVWAGLPTDQRSLLHFLLALTHVLLGENPSSPARR